MALGGMLALGSASAQDNNASAQAPAAAPKMRGPSIDQLAQDLNLTDDQKAKVKEALDNQMKKMHELRGLSQEDRRAKAQELRKELNAKMKSILTAEQYSKWEKSHMGGMRGPRGPRGGAGNTNAPAHD